MEALSRRVNTLMEYSLFGMGLSMAVIVAVQVFFRYALNRSLFWSEEVARFLLVWLTFLGATVAYYRGANPGVEALYDRLPEHGRRACKVAVYLLSLAFFAVMVIYGTQFAWFVRMQISPALRLPKWIPHGVVPISGSVMFLHALNFLTRALVGGREGAP